MCMPESPNQVSNQVNNQAPHQISPVRFGSDIRGDKAARNERTLERLVAHQAKLRDFLSVIEKEGPGHLTLDMVMQLRDSSDNYRYLFKRPLRSFGEKPRLSHIEKIEEDKFLSKDEIDEGENEIQHLRNQILGICEAFIPSNEQEKDLVQKVREALGGNVKEVPPIPIPSPRLVDAGAMAPVVVDEPAQSGASPLGVDTDGEGRKDLDQIEPLSPLATVTSTAEKQGPFSSSTITATVLNVPSLQGHDGTDETPTVSEATPFALTASDRENDPGMQAGKLDLMEVNSGEENRETDIVWSGEEAEALTMIRELLSSPEVGLNAAERRSLEEFLGSEKAGVLKKFMREDPEIGAQLFENALSVQKKIQSLAEGDPIRENLEQVLALIDAITEKFSTITKIAALFRELFSKDARTVVDADVDALEKSIHELLSGPRQPLIIKMLSADVELMREARNYHAALESMHKEEKESGHFAKANTISDLMGQLQLLLTGILPPLHIRAPEGTPVTSVTPHRESAALSVPENPLFQNTQQNHVETQLLPVEVSESLTVEWARKRMHTLASIGNDLLFDKNTLTDIEKINEFLVEENGNGNEAVALLHEDASFVANLFQLRGLADKRVLDLELTTNSGILSSDECKNAESIKKSLDFLCHFFGLENEVPAETEQAIVVEGGDSEIQVISKPSETPPVVAQVVQAMEGKKEMPVLFFDVLGKIGSNQEITAEDREIAFNTLSDIRSSPENYYQIFQDQATFSKLERYLSENEARYVEEKKKYDSNDPSVDRDGRDFFYFYTSLSDIYKEFLIIKEMVEEGLAKASEQSPAEAVHLHISNLGEGRFVPSAPETLRVKGGRMLRGAKAWAASRIPGIQKALTLKQETKEKWRASLSNAKETVAGNVREGFELPREKEEAKEALARIYEQVKSLPEKYSKLDPKVKLAIGATLLGVSLVGGAPVASAVYGGRLVLRGLGAYSAGKGAEEFYKKRAMNKWADLIADESVSDEEFSKRSDQIEKISKRVKYGAMLGTFLVGSAMDIVHLFEGSIAELPNLLPEVGVTEVPPLSETSSAISLPKLDLVELPANPLQTVIEVHSQGLSQALFESKDMIKTLTGVNLSDAGVKNYIANMLQNMSQEDLRAVGVPSGDPNIVGAGAKLDLQELIKKSASIRIQISDDGPLKTLLQRAQEV